MNLTPLIFAGLTLLIAIGNVLARRADNAARREAVGLQAQEAFVNLARTAIADVEILRRQIDGMRADNEELREQVIRAAAQNEALRSELQAARNENTALRNQILTLNHELTVANATIAALRQRVSELESINARGN